MAKAGRKHTAARQQSKCRPPERQIVVLSKSLPLDAGELGLRGDFESLASRREWKVRLYHLIDTHYRRTALAERQWWKVLDIADECARIPGTANVDPEKHNAIFVFLCQAIYRGELKDGKDRMQVANLHPSPHAPIRLDLKWLPFDQLFKFAKEGYLLVRRKECIDCFSRNNIDFPKTCLPSVSSRSDAPNTLPTPPASYDPDKPSDAAEPLADECRKPPDKQPRGREIGRAWSVARQIWSERGPPRSMSIPQVTQKMTEYVIRKSRVTNPDMKHQGGFSDSTIRRLLMGKR
jgi:hypothetical protein